MGVGLLHYFIGTVVLTVSLIFLFRLLHSFSNSVEDPIRKTKAKYTLIVTAIFCIFQSTIFMLVKPPFFESTRFIAKTIIQPFFINEQRSYARVFLNDITDFLLIVFYSTIIVSIYMLISKKKHNQSLKNETPQSGAS